MRTNAARQLDKSGVSYTLRDYEVDLDDLSAPSVAEKIGLPANQVFKTLVAKGDLNGIVLAVVPGDKELDLKALARASGNRKIVMVPMADLQHLTGYVRGGVTALACRKPYPVFLDNSATGHEVIAVSAGVRGTQIVLSPRDYAKSVEAQLVSIASQTPRDLDY
jgi:Cys-tRNA(Pro)/Cys-tRNA(Cys) deacylase